jgi:hypothetical protein
MWEKIADLTEEYWPRLTKDKRVHFVKTDFSKWKDQDERAFCLSFVSFHYS